jgi:acetolactate synthase small subunit
MLSFFSNYYGGSEAAATALQAKIQVFTQLNVAALAAELTVSEGLQDKLEVLHNEIDATHIAILETRVELEEFKHINNNVNDLKAKVIEVLQRKHREDTLAELNRAFADIDMTADVAMLSEHKNFIRKWALERANVMKDCKVQNMANLSVSEVKKIYVIALINILKKPELKKIDSTREYHFKIVMRYIARNKTTTSTSKELMKLIHINLGAVMLEDSKNIGAYLNGKEDAPIQTDAKILLDSLRKVLSPGDVNYVLEFINKITQQFYFNDYQNLLARIAVVLANNPIKTVLTNVTTKEQADHDDYYKQLAEVDLLGVNNTYTVELVAKAIKLIFDGTENAGAAPFLAGLNLNLVNKIASIFIKSINPIKRLVDLQTIVTNATNLLQLHEYITNFIGPVADIQPGSYEELLAGNEFAMSPELKAHKPANIVKLAKALEIGKQQIANFVANQEQVMSQKINKNIDIYVANALINSVYRALQ